jgi:hypothetical protein
MTARPGGEKPSHKDRYPSEDCAYWKTQEYCGRHAETDQSPWITSCVRPFNSENAEAETMEKRAPDHPEQDAQEEVRERPSEPPSRECHGKGDQKFGQDNNVFQGYASLLYRLQPDGRAHIDHFPQSSSEVTHRPCGRLAGKALSRLPDDRRLDLVS